MASHDAECGCYHPAGLSPSNFWDNIVASAAFPPDAINSALHPPKNSSPQDYCQQQQQQQPHGVQYNHQQSLNNYSNIQQQQQPQRLVLESMPNLGRQLASSPKAEVTSAAAYDETLTRSSNEVPVIAVVEKLLLELTGLQDSSSTFRKHQQSQRRQHLQQQVGATTLNFEAAGFSSQGHQSMCQDSRSTAIAGLAEFPGETSLAMLWQSMHHQQHQQQQQQLKLQHTLASSVDRNGITLIQGSGIPNYRQARLISLSDRTKQEMYNQLASNGIFLGTAMVADEDEDVFKQGSVEQQTRGANLGRLSQEPCGRVSILDQPGVDEVTMRMLDLLSSCENNQQQQQRGGGGATSYNRISNDNHHQTQPQHQLATHSGLSFQTSYANNGQHQRGAAERGKQAGSLAFSEQPKLAGDVSLASLASKTGAAGMSTASATSRMPQQQHHASQQNITTNNKHHRSLSVSVHPTAAAAAAAAVANKGSDDGRASTTNKRGPPAASVAWQGSLPQLDGLRWSRGTELHALGRCRPCVFFRNPVKGGCLNGHTCNFCHGDHPPQRKQPRPSKRHRTIQKALRLLTAAGVLPANSTCPLQLLTPELVRRQDVAALIADQLGATEYELVAQIAHRIQRNQQQLLVGDNVADMLADAASTLCRGVIGGSNNNNNSVTSNGHIIISTGGGGGGIDVEGGTGGGTYSVSSGSSTHAPESPESESRCEHDEADFSLALL